MSGSAHGHTTAAWTGVTICFIGFMVAGVAMVIPVPWLVVAGLVVAVVGPLIGKALAAAGFGKKPDSGHLAPAAPKASVGSGVSS
ncbi:HGxxPAAW family protein [Streptacidiphilus cavernicola]|uniref:HGxxPAAW family protein n=1 Tax=Streptacidiphilus cavernicola TaxID=3342716 RepID=A0ABV6VSY5_9ACTN